MKVPHFYLILSRTSDLRILISGAQYLTDLVTFFNCSLNFIKFTASETYIYPFSSSLPSHRNLRHYDRFHHSLPSDPSVTPVCYPYGQSSTVDCSGQAHVCEEGLCALEVQPLLLGCKGRPSRLFVLELRLQVHTTTLLGGKSQSPAAHYLLNKSCGLGGFKWLACTILTSAHYRI